MLTKMQKGVFFMISRKGRYTAFFDKEIKIIGFSGVASKKEAEGPLGKEFDKIFYDPMAGKPTWEQAESVFQQEAIALALSKALLKAEDIDYIFAGDLLNQCISSSFGLKEFSIPYLGQYGACSTMVQSLIMACVTLYSGIARHCAAVTSSHFCSAERQYRFPLEYGGQRTPTAQWTVTAAGGCILGMRAGRYPVICHATVGKIIDMSITDANNMGAAMAPAAADTILNFLEDTNTSPSDYDAIFTGDLGHTGVPLLYKLTSEKGVDLTGRHFDCGMLIYDKETQDVHSGGSGCGCCASVLCSHILPSMMEGKLNRILVVATGALMSPTSTQQGLSIPCIAHLVEIRI